MEVLIDSVGAYGAGIRPSALWAVLAMVVAQRAFARLGMWPYALIALPGTLAHELMHYFVALLLGTKPDFPRLWPERIADGWRLGAVSFSAPWWQAMPIAIAPVALLPLSVWWTAEQVSAAAGVTFWVHAWIAASLASASLPSRTDLRLAMPGLALLGIAGLAWLSWSLRPIAW